jgi:hypothetical protein
MFERFHIDFAKEGWRASNQRDAFPQMVTWLSHQEKISLFDNYLEFVDEQSTLPSAIPSSTSQFNPLNPPISTISIAKFPTFPRKHITSIEHDHHSPYFAQHLKEYLNSLLEHPSSNRTARLYALPFQRLDVFSQFKFHPTSLDDTDNSEENDTVKAFPGRGNKDEGRFDTVIVLRKNEAEATGMEGR